MLDTLIEIFLHAATNCRKPALFMRKSGGRWEGVSAEQSLADVESLAHGLCDLGVSRGDRVLLLSETRYEWPVADLAILSLGAATVPVYPTLTPPQVRYIMENAGAKVAIVSTAQQLEKLHAAADGYAGLRAVVYMDPAPGAKASDHALAAVQERGAKLRAAAPAAFPTWAARVMPEDLATIIYTSGTTGEPKGAMLTHGNIASNVYASLKVLEYRDTDTSLSWLPLCHIFERMAGLYATLAAGVTIAYAQSFETLAADALEVRPTVMTGVPRFYEKFHARVIEASQAHPAPVKRLFDWALGCGTRMARARFERRAPSPLLALQARLADRLVTSKIRGRVGGRLRFCISGSAPLSATVMEFFFAIGIPVVEGYGLTETSPVICVNRLGREKAGSVGQAIPGVEVRIGEDGEILTRGPHVMKGYFKNEEATRQALRGGWFHTGDVGHLDAEGFLFITDRLKDLLVLAGGKKAAPQPLEAKLKQGRWVSEAVLLGDRRPYVVALLVPNFANLEAEAKARGWPSADREALLRRPEVLGIFQGEIDRLNADLAGYEQVKKFALLGRELTQQEGDLTPTLKVKRRVVAQKFASVIDGLYAGIAMPASV